MGRVGLYKDRREPIHGGYTATSMSLSSLYSPTLPITLRVLVNVPGYSNPPSVSVLGSNKPSSSSRDRSVFSSATSMMGRFSR